MGISGEHWTRVGNDLARTKACVYRGTWNRKPHNESEYSPACPLGGNAECIRGVYIVCVYIAVVFQARVAGRAMYVVYTSRCILGN